MGKKYRPGQEVPTSGQYALFNSAGHKTQQERTCTRGEKFPPTPKKGYQYLLVDKTKHK